jgi:hypothetical protein
MVQISRLYEFIQKITLKNHLNINWLLNMLQECLYCYN